jgi:hypothetical protein
VLRIFLSKLTSCIAILSRKIESVRAVKGRSNLSFAANLMRANISHTSASFIPANLLSTEKCFASGFGSGVVERLLSKRNDSVSLPYAIIVIGGSVEHGTTWSNQYFLRFANLRSDLLVPNGEIVLVPLKSNLKVVVFSDEFENYFVLARPGRLLISDSQ